MKHEFEEVSFKASKSVKCWGCGKRMKRTKKFWQTLNPFNKNSEGLPKDREEIMFELLLAEGIWRSQEEFCISCDAKANKGE